MKLSELIRKYPFDAIVPELIAQDPKTESQLAWYKQAYDTLLETASAEDSWKIEVTREYDVLDGWKRHYYVHAHDCEGMPWDGCLASEVVLRMAFQNLAHLPVSLGNDLLRLHGRRKKGSV